MRMEQTHAVHTELKLPLERRLRLGEDYDALSAFRLLSRSISRYPHDLRAHAQRILLATQPSHVDSLAGALQDLSIALAGKGKPFFTQLLETVKPSLAEADYSRLLSQFDADTPDQCWHKGSVLANGVCEKNKLVSFSGVETSEFENILDEARSYIEYGQIENAQELLEQELLENGLQSTEVTEELLNLYQYTRNRSQLESMSLLLKERNFELSPEWQQCLQHAESW